jgi:acetyl esterase/lipase
VARKRRHATAPGTARRIAAAKSASTPPGAFARRFAVAQQVVDGFDVYVVRPTDFDFLPEPSGTVIYLHGGAFIGEIQRLRWALISKVVSEAHVEVCVPIYGLAPEHHADEAIRLMHKVLTEASGAGPTYLMGDSAGGGLALSATLSWLGGGGRPPRGLTLIAPWLDLGLRNPAIADVESRDPWLSRPGLRLCAQAWADQLSLDDPRVSPISGEFQAVPPIELYVGSRDITVADCRALRDRVPAGRLRYHEEPGAVHVYPLLPTPEGVRRDASWWATSDRLCPSRCQPTWQKPGAKV